MNLKSYSCPGCGATLKVDSACEGVACEYCGQHYSIDRDTLMLDDTITDLINSRIEEKHNIKAKHTLVIIVASIVAILTILMLTLAFINPDVLAQNAITS